MQLIAAQLSDIDTWMHLTCTQTLTVAHTPLVLAALDAEALAADDGVMRSKPSVSGKSITGKKSRRASVQMAPWAQPPPTTSHPSIDCVDHPNPRRRKSLDMSAEGEADEHGVVRSKPSVSAKSITGKKSRRASMIAAPWAQNQDRGSQQRTSAGSHATALTAATSTELGAAQQSGSALTGAGAGNGGGKKGGEGEKGFLSAQNSLNVPKGDAGAGGVSGTVGSLEEEAAKEKAIEE